MHVIRVRNVCEALPRGLGWLMEHGREEVTRNGPAWVAPCPVTTVYERPLERVLANPARDANPFFHLMEAMWMLAGRNDAAFLDQYVRDFGARYAQPDGLIHGAYGHRWRVHFDDAWADQPLDQLSVVAVMLDANPASRQAVIAMWDPSADLMAPSGVRDRPCNTHAYLRVREADGEPEPYGGASLVREVLDLTVCCRSNDIIWGAYGANAVHFAFLQEYLAARIGVGVGQLYQVSNNYHAYSEVVGRLLSKGGSLSTPSVYDTGALPQALVDYTGTFDGQLRAILQGQYPAPAGRPNHFLYSVVRPAMDAHARYRGGDHVGALEECQRITAHDWRVACLEWLTRRSPR